MIYLGIDPGANGAIASATDMGIVVHPFSKLTEQEIWDLFRGHGTNACMAMIERVGAMPRQGVSSTFKFGRHYGFLRACLVAANIPHSEVAPATWQRAMGCLSGGDKRFTRQRAQQLWPEARMTHATADAALIAEYCRRQNGI